MRKLEAEGGVGGGGGGGGVFILHVARNQALL